MALTCARCGAQNPDGNQFCQACGTPLTPAVAAPPQAPPPPPSWLAAPPPGPPPGAVAPPLAYASPPPAPVAYASPYYAPSAAAPPVPVHRTPWMLIIAAVVGLVVVMAGCGTALALLGNKASPSSGIAADVPSPTPAGSPSPVPSPVPQGPTASNDAETVPVLPGWVVSSKDNTTIALSDPSGLGALAVVSAVQSPAMSAQQQRADLDSSLKAKYPDTIQCGNTHTTTGALGGVQGIFWQLCFTIVSGGRSLPAEASNFVGTNADGSVFYGVILMTAQTYMQNFTTESAPVLKGIVWKLK